MKALIHGKAGTYQKHACRCVYCKAAGSINQRSGMDRAEKSRLIALVAEAALAGSPVPDEAYHMPRVVERAPKPEPVPEAFPERGYVRLTHLGYVYTCKACNDFRGPYVFEDQARDARTVHKERAHVE